MIFIQNDPKWNNLANKWCVSTFKIKVDMELLKTKLKATLENEPKIEIVCVDALIYGRISNRTIQLLNY